MTAAIADARADRGVSDAPGPGGPEEPEDPGRRPGPPRPAVRPGRANGRCGSRRWTPCSGGSSRSRRDGLRIDARPDGRAGCSASTRRGGEARASGRIAPSLSGVDPIEARCDCPDFLKNSLGVCKHVLVVLEHLYARPRLLQQALKEQERARAPPAGRPALGPDPAADRAGDWLERVAWLGPPEADGAAPGRRRGPRTWFRRGDGRRPLVLKDAYPRRPGEAAGAGRGPAQGRPARREPGPARPGAARPARSRERDRLRRIVEAGARARRDRRRRSRG